MVFIITALVSGQMVLDEAKGGQEGPAIIAPREGARVGNGPVVIIMKAVRGKEQINLTMDGKQVNQLQLEGTMAWAILKLGPGRHLAEARYGRQAAALTQRRFDVGAAPGSYTYHDPVVKGSCGSCHVKSGALPSLAPVRIACYKCHPSWSKRSFLHGPIGAGECAFCHDPHGSSNPKLGRHEPGQECFLCHDQPSSRGHVNRRQAKACLTCHDPHAADKRFILK